MHTSLTLAFIASAAATWAAPSPLAPSSDADWPPAPHACWLDITMDEYAAQLIAVLATDHRLPDFKYITDEGSLISKSSGVRVSLANTYAAFMELPLGERPASIRRVAAGIARMRDDDPLLEEVRGMLLPKVWSHSGLGMLAAERFGLGATSTDVAVTVPGWRLGEHMAAFLAINYPDSVQAVTPELLLRWGVPKEVLCNEAEERLASLRLSWEAMSIEGEDGPLILLPEFPEDETYFASQLLLVAKDERLGVQDGARAALPSKDTLLVYIDTSAGLNEIFIGEIERASSGPYPLSPVPLVLKDGVWKDWTVPSDDPQRHRYRNAFREFQSSLYAGQASVLRGLQDSLVANDGDRAAAPPAIPKDRIPAEYIATYELYREEGEAELFSRTIWAENVDYLLPRVDRLALLPEGGGPEDVVAVKWSQVEELAKELLVPVPGTVPPLYRTRGFPGKQVLKRLTKPN